MVDDDNDTKDRKQDEERDEEVEASLFEPGDGRHTKAQDDANGRDAPRVDMDSRGKGSECARTVSTMSELTKSLIILPTSPTNTRCIAKTTATQWNSCVTMSSATAKLFSQYLQRTPMQIAQNIGVSSSQ
ncbi:MAG TPA: hypothetical protein VEK34_05845 [Methylocella sp.]|nr:hypothetical protein [Methylocella sp.]